MLYDRSITNKMSELEVARANAAKTELERKLHLEQARQHATRLTGTNADSGHGYVTLVKLAMGRLREVLEKPVVDDEDVTAAAKQVEEALSDGLQQFRN